MRDTREVVRGRVGVYDATTPVTQHVVPVLRPSRCYVCVMGGVRPAPKRRLVGRYSSFANKKEGEGVFNVRGHVSVIAE